MGANAVSSFGSSGAFMDFPPLDGLLQSHHATDFSNRPDRAVVALRRINPNLPGELAYASPAVMWPALA